MTGAWVALALVALACALDGLTTLALLERGGHEEVSAWIIGAHPTAWLVWAWVLAFPVACTALALWCAPEAWPAALPLVVWRLYYAMRNHRLRR